MAANVYTIFEYAANKNWGGIDALDSRTRRAKGVAVQRRLLRDVCTSHLACQASRGGAGGREDLVDAWMRMSS